MLDISVTKIKSGIDRETQVFNKVDDRRQIRCIELLKDHLFQWLIIDFDKILYLELSEIIVVNNYNVG